VSSPTQTAQFLAIGTTSTGQTANLTNSVTWSSSSQQIATIGAATGLATAVGQGTVTITALYNSGGNTLTATAAFTVLGGTAEEYTAVTIVPGSQSVSASGQTGQFIALATSGTTGLEQDVTNSPQLQWISSIPTVATITSGLASGNGLASGVSQGTSTITAELKNPDGSLVSNSATVTVTLTPAPEPLLSLTIIPSSITVPGDRNVFNGADGARLDELGRMADFGSERVPREHKRHGQPERRSKRRSGHSLWDRECDDHRRGDGPTNRFNRDGDGDVQLSAGSAYADNGRLMLSGLAGVGAAVDPDGLQRGPEHHQLAGDSAFSNGNAQRAALRGGLERRRSWRIGVRGDVPGGHDGDPDGAGRSGSIRRVVVQLHAASACDSGRTEQLPSHVDLRRYGGSNLQLELRHDEGSRPAGRLFCFCAHRGRQAAKARCRCGERDVRRIQRLDW